MYGKIAISAAVLAGLTSAAPSTSSPESFSKRISDSYTPYTGDGSNWPSMDQWGSFSDLWAANSAVMAQSCGWNGWGAEDSSDEINNIQNAIQQLSQSTGVDNRFILAIIMQESKGCVRVPTTNNGVVNPGLMQSHNGSGSCAGVDPCPADQITQMVSDGTAGTSDGDGLQQTLAWAQSQGASDARAYYIAARKYNSGSADLTNLDNGLGSTACYAEDVANRLTGWTLAASACQA